MRKTSEEETLRKLLRSTYLSMRARREGYKTAFHALKQTNSQKEVFKQLTLEMTHWTDVFKKAFPDETTD